MSTDAHVSRLLELLGRNTPLDAREALFNALDPKQRIPSFSPGSDAFAIGFDTNAAFRIGLNGQRGADAIDYLSTRHTGPLILPGQALQEIWNNSIEGLDPQAKKLAAALKSLQDIATEIGQTLGPTGNAAQSAIEDLNASHGDWISPTIRATFERTMEMFLKRADVVHVPRGPFQSIAEARHKTKTPPGFRDPANTLGDFYVWADFLLGAMRAAVPESEVVVFVTNDTKKDWSRHGVIHPVLMAEANEALQRPFFMLTVDEFQKFAATRA